MMLGNVIIIKNLDFSTDSYNYHGPSKTRELIKTVYHLEVILPYVLILAVQIVGFIAIYLKIFDYILKL